MNEKDFWYKLTKIPSGTGETASIEDGDMDDVVESNKLGNLFIVGAAYKIMSDSQYGGSPIVGDDKTVRTLSVTLLGRQDEESESGSNIEDIEDARRKLIERIGKPSDTLDPEANEPNDIDYGNGLITIQTKLGNCGFEITHLDKQLMDGETIDEVSLKESVQFMKYLMNEKIWENTVNRDNLKKILGSDYKDENESDFLKEVKRRLENNYQIFWIEDVNDPENPTDTKVVLLLESEADSYVFGLCAQADNTGWIGDVVDAICNELDRNSDNNDGDDRVSEEGQI